MSIERDGRVVQRVEHDARSRVEVLYEHVWANFWLVLELVLYHVEKTFAVVFKENCYAKLRRRKVG